MANEYKEPKQRYGWAWAIVTIGLFLGLAIWFLNLGDGLNDTPPTIEEQIEAEQQDE